MSLSSASQNENSDHSQSKVPQHVELNIEPYSGITEPLPASKEEVEVETGGNEELRQFSESDDPLNPYRWSKQRKWAMVLIISMMSTINTTATLTCTPAVPQILAAFHVKNDSYSTLLVSIWELGEGIGPFFIGPLSEYFGRRPVWHVCNTLFALCSMASALSVSVNMLTAFRFLNGLSVASITLGPTIISDMFAPGQRATAMSITAMLPMVGPTIGPIIGSFVSQAAGWRWIFWIFPIAVGVFEIPSLLVFKETYAVKILRDKAGSHSHSRGPRPKFSFNILLRAVKIWLFYHQVFILALYLAVAYGYQYLVFTTFTEVLESQYMFRDSVVGVAYIGIGFGSLLGILTVGIASDWYVRRQGALRGSHKPEDRIAPIIIGGIIMSGGLFLYGWTAQEKVQWMAPIIGTALQGFGLGVILISTQTYLVDAFPVHAASASAAGSILRSLAGAVMPLAGPPLYRSLGLGWGNSLLGFTALAFLVVPLLLLLFGERGRNRWNAVAKL